MSPGAVGGGAPLRVAGAVAVVLLVGLLALPLLALLLGAPPAVLLARLREPVVLQALRLSLFTSGAVTVGAIGLGLPTAYLLATRRFPGKRALETLIALPMVLPPTVAGFALLLAFGRAGLLGRALGMLGVSLPFSTLGVIVAQLFMATPFFIAPVRAGLAGVDRRYLDAARTLRATETRIFFTVRLPLARAALAAGVAMAWARALGEFGATITFAGNFPGRTQTMPLAVYLALQDNLDAAVALSVLLLIMACVLLTALRWSPVGLFGIAADAAGDPS